MGGGSKGAMKLLDGKLVRAVLHLKMESITPHTSHQYRHHFVKRVKNEIKLFGKQLEGFTLFLYIRGT